MQSYNTIIGVIQMRQDNCPSRSIMERYRIGSGTVSLIINRYASSGLSLQQLQQLSAQLAEAVELGRSCGMTEPELTALLRRKWEDTP